MGGYRSSQTELTVEDCSSCGKPQDELSGITVKAKAESYANTVGTSFLEGAVETRYRNI